MNKNLSLEIKLIRKKFQIYGFFNIFSLFFVIFSLLIGFKTIMLVLGHYPQILALLFAMLIITNLTDVTLSEDKLYRNLSQTRAFFPSISIKSVKFYQGYKKLITSYLISIYILFPMSLSLKNIIYFLFAMTLFTLFTLINTAYKKYISGDSEFTTTGIKVLTCLVLVLGGRGVLPISVSDFFSSLNVQVMIISLLVMIVVIIWMLYPRKGIKDER